MALVCRTGWRECDGCGDCFDSGQETVDVCAACCEPVYVMDDRFDFDGEIVHEDCLHDWAERFRVIPE